MKIDLKLGLPANVTVVSNEFIDQYMAAANGEYVKVFLYLLRHEREELDLASIADALNHTEADVKRALAYAKEYEDQGIGLNDLIQEASMELMLLADEGFEGSFETLLESRIRVRLEEVVKEQKSEADIEEEMLARVNVLQEVSKTMAEQLGREATLAELAERMKMTEDEVREIMKVTMDALSMSEINRSLQS